MGAEERAAARRAKDGKKTLPIWWKGIIYFCSTCSAAGGWLYTSGGFASKVYGCTVEISTLDDFVANGIAFCGAVALIAIFGGLYHLEN